MYVYIRSEPELWTVGFYTPNGTWMPESDHDSKQDALDRVALLNGCSSEIVDELRKRIAKLEEELNALIV